MKLEKGVGYRITIVIIAALIYGVIIIFLKRYEVNEILAASIRVAYFILVFTYMSNAALFLKNLIMFVRESWEYRGQKFFVVLSEAKYLDDSKIKTRISELYFRDSGNPAWVFDYTEATPMSSFKALIWKRKLEKQNKGMEEVSLMLCSDVAFIEDVTGGLKDKETKDKIIDKRKKPFDLFRTIRLILRFPGATVTGIINIRWVIRGIEDGRNRDEMVEELGRNWAVLTTGISFLFWAVVCYLIYI